MVTGLNHLDRFAWIGAFSAGGLNTNFVAQFPSLDSGVNQKLGLLWISCGRDDRLIDSNQQLCRWLDSKGVRYKWLETEGEHSVRVWRRNLASFASLLFLDKKTPRLQINQRRRVLGSPSTEAATCWSQIAGMTLRARFRRAESLPPLLLD